MINLLTRASTNCLPFQNQIANHDKTAGNATFVFGCRGGVLQGLNDSDLRIYKSAGIYFIVTCSRPCIKIIPYPPCYPRPVHPFHRTAL
jgi:hypothetical protein